MDKVTGAMTIAEYKAQMASKGKKKGSPEHDEQVKVFAWAKIMESKYPELEMLMAIPNGAFYGGHWSVANRMKAEGVKSGVPDIFLPVSTNEVEDYECGLWIEMKAGKNRTSENQEWWLKKLAEQGYRTRVCYSAEEAMDEIEDYLNCEG